ncbi:MAG: D-arabinono-1,4-lactone oxidase [Nevskiales bacterium]|nr:D-arabinono-1,4-lactone oxidase [Nevskiales bacterium]
MHRRRQHQPWSNWSRTVRCEVVHHAHPVNVEQIQAEVLRAAEEGERIRVVGSGASFSPLCWTDENHLSLERFTGIESVDVERRRVWVRGGTPLRRLSEALAERGLALEIAPDFDQMTIAGAISTASHGSGATFGNLATLVTGLRMVCSDGSVQQVSPATEPERFEAACVSLGALGVITHVELQCVDDYRLAVASRRTTLGTALATLEQLRRDHRNTELFWFPYADAVIVREFDPTRELPPRLMPARHALRRGIEGRVFRAMSSVARHAPRLTEPLAGLIASRVANRHEVLHAREAYPIRRYSRFQQLEYALPVDALGDALKSLNKLIKALDLRIHFPLEVRFVRGDRFWLSPHYGRDSACITVPAYADMAFDAYFAPIADILERHDGRPHLGMVHDRGADELRGMFPRFDDFCRMRRDCDPNGVFLNPHLAGLFGEALDR